MPDTKRCEPRENGERPSCAALYMVVMAGLMCVTASAARGQGVVARNVNLRVHPSTAEEPIELLTPGIELRLLDDGRKTNGYYHVVTYRVLAQCLRALGKTDEAVDAERRAAVAARA